MVGAKVTFINYISFMFFGFFLLSFSVWFQRYGSLLKVLNQRIGGDPLNSLFREGLHQMLDWSKTHPPDDDSDTVKDLSDSVRLIMENISHPARDVTRDNMVRSHGKCFNSMRFQTSLSFSLIVLEFRRKC